MIPFNKPFLSGNELTYIQQAVASGKISGDGEFTLRSQQFLQRRYGFLKTLLTSSCTDALEMAAILSNVGPGDEVIAPSFTFVSTVNPFVMRGARIVFADIQPDIPNIDPASIAQLITPRTRVIVVVHYAGIACQMDEILHLAAQHGIMVVEDAAHAIDSYYQSRPLGSLGQMGTFSFHETKNIISGEGGMLVLNDASLVERAEIIREKGTNRSKFFRGEVDKYSWVDVGSSFLPSEITAAFLFAQLEALEQIQQRRKQLWKQYELGLRDLASEKRISLPVIPSYATNNAHLFFILAATESERNELLAWLKSSGILAIFHYLPLHSSPFFKSTGTAPALVNTDSISARLVRLPLFYELNEAEVDYIVSKIKEFYAGRP